MLPAPSASTRAATTTNARVATGDGAHHPHNPGKQIGGHHGR